MSTIQLFDQRIIVTEGNLLDSIREELRQRKAKRVLLLGSARALGQWGATSDAFAHWDVAQFSTIAQHVPRELVDDAGRIMDTHRPDTIVSIGGGSTLGFAKALAVSHPSIVVSVPTTLAGSEATSIYGVTENGVKVTRRNPLARPTTIIYDGSLLFGLSKSAIADSAANALAHCLDAFFTPNFHPVIASVAQMGVWALRESVGPLIRGVASRDEATTAMMGSYWAGVALEFAGSGPHHKICHHFGGGLGTPHSATHASVLPWALALSAQYSPDRAAKLAKIFSSGDLVAAVLSQLEQWGSTRTLGGYIDTEDIPSMADSLRQTLQGSLADSWTTEDVSALIAQVFSSD
jgi:alcohol dehydrogenase class IV